MLSEFDSVRFEGRGRAIRAGARRDRQDVRRGSGRDACWFALLGLSAVLLGLPVRAVEPPAADSLQPIDLRSLLADAERLNPELLTASARVRASEHVPSQSEAPPDPMASVAYTNDGIDEFTLGTSDMSTLAFTWSQEVPYSGKLRLAGDVARADIEVKRQDEQTVRRAVLAGVKRAYAELFRIDRTRTILIESRTLLQSFLDGARRRYESGEGILENVLKAQTEITRLDVELETLVQERRSAGARVNVLAGRPAGAPLGVASTPLLAAATDEAALEAAATEHSPELLGRQAAAHREEIRVDLAKRNLKPDFAWSVAYMNRGGLEPMVMGMFGMRLPVYRDRKQEQAVAQTQEDLEAARQESEGVRLQVASSVRDLAARAERARMQMRLYAEGVLPQSRSALDSAAASYAAGRTEFLTLIADFLTVLDTEKSLAAQQAEEAFALAALEPLTGMTLLTPAEGDRHE